MTISSPMIGRDAELEQLRARLGRLVGGEGGIVSLVGEAGIGKSRLVREALALEEARPVKLLVGRSQSAARTFSFHPFSDLLRGWAGIAGGALDDEAVECLDQAVRAVCGAEADEIVPFVAALMGLRTSGARAQRLGGLEGESLERLVFKNVRALFRSLAAEQPLVVFLEDLHWADRSSVQLLEMLLGLVEESPILFILAFRPEHAETGQRILEFARTQHPLQHRVLALRPLGAQDCGALAQNLLGLEHASAAGALIAGKADGNPFFVEEVVSSLLDEGTVELREGRLHLTRPLEAIAIPGSVREIVLARIGRLDADTRSLLDVAAVIGRVFLGRVLAEVLSDDRGLEVRLASLKERNVLLERRTRRTAAHARRMLFQEIEYVFRHALVQETIYETIPDARRRDLHARIASAVERVFADRIGDFYGMLAYHYVRAESLEKAEEYLFKAGEQAARAAASSEALAFFREAARVYLRLHGAGGDTAKRAALERNIGLALMNTGQLAESMPHFDRALAHLGDPVAASMTGAAVRFVADAVAVAARLFLPTSLFRSPRGSTRYRENIQVRYARIKAQSTSDPTRLLFDYTRAVRLLNDTDPEAVPEQVIGLYGGFAAMFAYSGLSFRIGRRYLALADSLRRPGHAKDLFDQRCLVCIHNYLEGVWDDASGTVADEVVSAALRHGGLWEVNTYIGLDADRRLRRGDFDGARRRIDQLADIAETYGFEFARTNQSAETVQLLLEERRLDAALDAANLYHAVVRDDPLRVLALGSKAKAQVLLGDRDGASRTLKTAEKIVARAAIVPPWHLSALAVGRLLHDSSELEAAEASDDRERWAGNARRSARFALRIAARVAVQRGEIYRLVARLHLLLRHERLAVRWLDRALAECERLGARPELARAHLDAAAAGIVLADGLSSEAHRARARELFDTLGLPREPEAGSAERHAA